MTKNLLQGSKEDVYKKIQEELGKSKDDINADIKIIQEWCKTQPHLPEIPKTDLVQAMLLINKFSIERTKQRLDMYYTIRRTLPEFFDQHPCSPEMIQQARVTIVVPLPKRLPDQRRVLYSKFSEDCGPEMFNQERFLAHSYNILEVLMRDDVYIGCHYIFDCAAVKMGHLTKINPIVFKKSSVVMEKVFSNRVASIHLINFHPFIESTLNLIKPFFAEKIRSRIFIHKDTEGLFNIFPKELLPKDVGGDEMSAAELTELWIKKMEEHKPLFDRLISLKVDESKRPTKLVNDEVLGFYGNFKKLDID